MQSVVTGQAPITLERKITSGGKHVCGDGVGGVGSGGAIARHGVCSNDDATYRRPVVAPTLPPRLHEHTPRGSFRFSLNIAAAAAFTSTTTATCSISSNASGSLANDAHRRLLVLVLFQGETMARRGIGGDGPRAKATPRGRREHRGLSHGGRECFRLPLPKVRKAVTAAVTQAAAAGRGGGRGLAAVAATRAAAATSAAAAPAAVAAAVIADSDENTAAAFFFLLTPLHYSTEYSASQPRVGARQRPLLLVRPRAAVQAASAIAAQKRGTFCLA